MLCIRLPHLWCSRIQNPIDLRFKSRVMLNLQFIIINRFICSLFLKFKCSLLNVVNSAIMCALTTVTCFDAFITKKNSRPFYVLLFYVISTRLVGTLSEMSAGPALAFIILLTSIVGVRLWNVWWLDRMRTSVIIVKRGDLL